MSTIVSKSVLNVCHKFSFII